MKCGIFSILWEKLKRKKKKQKPEEKEIQKEPIELLPEIHPMQEDDSDDILEQMKALGSGHLGSGLADMNFQGSIIHIEEMPRESSSTLHATLERKKSTKPKISIDKDSGESVSRHSFSLEQFEYQESLQHRASVRRKKDKRDSSEVIKPLIDLTPTSVITKGALLDTYDKKVKPPLDPKLLRSKSRTKSQNFEETLSRSKSMKRDDSIGTLRRKKSQKYVDDDETASRTTLSRKLRNESDVDLSRSRSTRRLEEDSSSNNDDNVPLGATLSRSRSKKEISGTSNARRKDLVAKLAMTDDDISDRPPDYDIEPVRSIRQHSNGSGMLEHRRSRTDLSRTKSERSRRRSRSRKRNDSDDDEPLANVALQALQQNLASNKPSRLR
jgi:hypothetical protein